MTETNRLILRRPQPQELFSGICDICVSAWRADGAFLDVLEDKRPQRVASAGTVEHPAGAEDGSHRAESLEVQQFLTSLTLRSGETTVSNDVRHDPRLAAWGPWYARHGIAAVVALPLKRGGATIGTLALFSRQARFFDKLLLRLLGEMADDMVFALDNADRERSVQVALLSAERGQHLFRTLFDAAPIPMMVFGLEQRQVVKVNDLVCQILGIRRDEVLGKTASEIGSGSSGGVREFFEETLRLPARVAGLPARLRASEGAWSNVLLNAEPVDYLGRASMLVVATDVSEVKAAQLAVRARLAAEEANRAKTAFLSQMSHELRTPLNAVLGFAQLLAADEDRKLSQKQTEWVAHILKAGWHVLGLVNDVLDLSLIESGRVEVVAANTPLAAVIDEALDLIRPQAEIHGVELRRGYAQSLDATVRADSHRLRQVLVNVLSNAVKYNRLGGWIDVRIGRHAGTIAIDVMDSGVGMTDQQLGHLFEPFNRLGRQGGAVEGIGIGLALSRQLMHLMGGKFEVTSVHGSGTRVRLLLPFGIEAANSPRDEDAHPIDAAIGSPPEGVVLYIEDDPVNRLVVENMLLSRKSVRLLAAENGRSGIERAIACQPDLVLLDMQLPDMSGLDVLKALRADPRTRSLWVVALSASAMPGDVALAKELGAMDYWTKPLDLQAFLGGITTLLGPSGRAVRKAMGRESKSGSGDARIAESAQSL
ncbi:MAG: ATP-binding protein [Caldimonas sp.]